MNQYIRTYGGTKFPVYPRAADIHLEDIAVPLSRIPRFSGNTTIPYSVAAHCLHVALLVPMRLRVPALFHDASEAYIQDIPSPFKHVIPDYRVLENTIMRAVAERFHFHLPLDPLIKQADQAALYLERVALFDTPWAADAALIPFVEPPRKVRWNFQAWSGVPSQTLACIFLSFAKKILDI